VGYIRCPVVNFETPGWTPIEGEVVPGPIDTRVVGSEPIGSEEDIVVSDVGNEAFRSFLMVIAHLHSQDGSIADSTILVG
jgi:hypothetical protein